MQPLRAPRVDGPLYSLEWSDNYKNIGYIPEARHSHGACVIANKMYVFAGHHTNELSLSNTACLDLDVMVWAEIKSAVAAPRKGVPLTSWGNRLYSFGGWCTGPNMTAIYSNELLTLNLDMPHPNNNLLNTNLSNVSPLNSNRFDAVPQWFTVRANGALPAARWGHSLTAIGSQLFMFGGCGDKGPTNEFICFDIPTNLWTVVHVRGPSPSPRYNHTALAHEHYLIVFGGVAIYDDKNSAYFNDVWIFDSKTTEWWSARVVGTPPSQRCGHAMTMLDASTVNAPLPPHHALLAVLGGFERTNICNDLHLMILDPTTKEVKWMAHEVMGPNRFYRSDAFQCVLREDWTCPTPRYGHTICSYKNKIILFGGADNCQSLNELKVLTMEPFDHSKLIGRPVPPVLNSNNNVINKIPGVEWSPHPVKKSNSLPESLDPDDDLALHKRVVSLANSLPVQIPPPVVDERRRKSQEIDMRERPNVFEGIQFHDLGAANNNQNAREGPPVGMQLEPNPLAQSLVASKHPELYRDLNGLFTEFQSRLVNSLDRQLLENSVVEPETAARLRELEQSLSESELVKTQLLTEKVEWHDALTQAEQARRQLELSAKQLSEARSQLEDKCKQLELEKSQLEEQTKNAIPALDEKMSLDQLKELENKLKNHLKDIKTLREKKVEELTRSQAQRKEEDNTCVICYERTKEMVFIPCGHICLCAQCGEGKTSCPICRAEGKAIKIFTV